MRSAYALPPLCLLAACGLPGLAVPVERLEAPAEVVVTDAVAGASTQRAFPITNGGAASAWISLDVDAPFYVTTPRLFLAAGATATVRLGVIDPGYDTITGVLEIRGPYDAVTVPVSAVFDLDRDDDGVNAIAAGGADCDDEDAEAFPGAPERCNGRDDDCDVAIDEDAVDAHTWYRDLDADGWGDAVDSAAACDRPTGFAPRPGDCAPSDPDVNPGATEVFYDGVDQDCSGTSDFDRDADGHEHPSFGGDDCRDDDPDIHPGAPEIDDLVDQDCDRLVDEDFLAPGALVFTEILVDPEVRAPERGQYVEIANPSATRTVQVRGMTVTSGAGSAQLPAALLAPGGVGLLCADTRPSLNGGLTCLGPLPDLLDEADAIAISADVVLDEVDWTGWTVVPGRALELTTIDADANDDPSAWCVAEPTEGGSPGDLTPTCAAP